MLSLISPPRPSSHFPHLLYLLVQGEILQPDLQGVSRCCMNTHIGQDPCGDGFLQPVPRQQTGRDEPRQFPPSDAQPAPLPDTTNGIFSNPENQRAVAARAPQSRPLRREGRLAEGTPCGISLLTAKPRSGLVRLFASRVNCVDRDLQKQRTRCPRSGMLWG